MNLAIDIDGCLADFNTGYLKLLRRIRPGIKVDEFALNFPPTWQWPEYYGYTADEEKAAWAEIEASDNFWKNLHPYPTAYGDLEHLYKLSRKHDVYFLTHRRGRDAKWQTEQWLESQGFDRPTVVLSGKKGEFCEAAAIDVIIDDKPGNLMTQWHDLKTVLFKRPYNMNYWTYFSRAADTIREGLDGLV